MTLTRSRVAQLLAEHGLRPSRALGQNFVVDPNTVRRIAREARLGRGARVVEVGAGLGCLTLALAETGAEVTAVEVDRRLVPVLRSLVEPAGVRVVEADALRLDWDRLLVDGGEWVMVGNLPYNVATPLVVKILEEVPSVRRLLVMAQAEVAERWAAGPGEPDYGAVSVKVAHWAAARVVGPVPPTVFLPRPRVGSALVEMTRREGRTGGPAYEATFVLVRAGFAGRRKMLRRALAGLVGAEVFDLAGVRPDARAEELSLDDWERLAAWRHQRSASGPRPS